MKRRLILLSLFGLALVGGSTAIIYGPGSAQAKPADSWATIGPKVVRVVNPDGTYRVLDRRTWDAHGRHNMAWARAQGMSPPRMPEDIGNHPQLGGRCYSPGQIRCCYNAFTGGYVSCQCNWISSLDGYTWTRV